jgi:hypothetical protein
MVSSAATDWDNGVSAWNASPALIYFNRQSSCCTHIQLDALNTSYYSWDGLSQCYFNAWGYFTQCNEYINLYDNGPAGPGIGGYPVGKRQAVTAHELGHVLGLAHTNGCVLMQPDTAVLWDTCGINTPQADDVAGVNAMY